MSFQISTTKQPIEGGKARVSLKAAQQRLGHSRPGILLRVYTHVLDASADLAAATLSGQLGGGGFSAPVAAHAGD